MRNCDPCWSAVLSLLVWLSGGFSAGEFSARAEEKTERWNERATRSNWWRTPRDYNTKYHPWIPPGSLEAWEQMAPRLREQLLIAQGLWPLPEKSPLSPVIHGKLDCGDYTIEKVYFASRPGLYVTGNLYRPVGYTGPRPGVLSPHGHWPNGPMAAFMKPTTSRWRRTWPPERNHSRFRLGLRCRPVWCTWRAWDALCFITT